uniref:Uncharacterized protein n=1 Tax=Anguilla anguilla TaxID=7936 RepID=A0A0E9U1L7_ANGAN
MQQPRGLQPREAVPL